MTDLRASIHACLDYYFVNHVTSYRCLACDTVVPASSVLPETRYGVTPLTTKRAQSFVDNNVLQAINAQALLGTSPIADAEWGES